MGNFSRTYAKHDGADFLANDLSREDTFSSDWLNVQHREDGSLMKRDGHKPVAPDIGGLGLYHHRKRDNTTGAETRELLTIGQDGRLYRAVRITWTVSYSGAAAAVTLNYYYDNTAYRFQIVVDGSTLISTTVGKGTDEGASFPVSPLSTLDSTVEALTGITTTLDEGTGSAAATSAAFLFPHYYNYDLKAADAVFYTYVWEEVNCPLGQGMFADHAALMEDENFELIDSTGFDALTYFANPNTELESGIVKYDGQTVYAAGMPKPAGITGSETNASGTAEVTSITCIADVVAPGISYVKFSDSGTWTSTELRETWFKLYEPAGTVGVWLQTAGSAAFAPQGVDRVLRITGLGSPPYTNAQVAAAVASVVNADASWVAAVDATDNTKVIITDASSFDHGAVEVTAYHGGNSITSGTIQQASAGLTGKYFVLSNATNRVGFWYDVNDAGTPQPSIPGVDLYVEITGVASSDTASTVATITEAVVEANGFSSSASGAVITATDDVAGARTDAEAGTSGFTVSVTTQGRNAGLGQATFTYHVTYEQKDAQNIFTEGEPSDDVAVTHSDGSKNTLLILPTIQPDRGFNTGCAQINGTQLGVNTITVDAGHTLVVGDQALIKSPSTTAAAQVETITCVADVSGSLDGKYFYLYSKLLGTERATAFWIDVDNNGTPEPSHGAPASEEITGITTGMTASQVATVVAAEIDAHAEWAATALGAVVTVTNAIVGNVTDSDPGSSTFAFAVTTNGRDGAPGALEERLVTAVASTTITVDGNPVSVTDNDAISNGLRINIWRTEADGTDISKFLVDVIPNNSLVTSVSYTDSVVDEDLGEPWKEPEYTHGLPPKVRYLAVWNKVLVGACSPTSPSSVYYSIPFDFSPEYFPAESNAFQTYSDEGDSIKGLYAFQDGVIVFKERSYFPVSGDIFTGNIRVDKRAQWDINFASQASLVELGGSLVYADRKGLFSVDLSSPPAEVSSKIRPRVKDNTLCTFNRTQGFYDRQRYRAIFQFTSQIESSTGLTVTDTTNTFTAVFNGIYQAWYIWRSLDMSAGCVEFDEEILFQGWRADAAGNRTSHLMRLHDEIDTPYAYQDHDTAITAYVKTAWYSEGAPQTHKAYNFVKFYSEGSRSSVLQPLDISTEIDLISGTAHTTTTWDTSSTRSCVRRLRPKKVNRMRLIVGNDDANTNLLLTGWQLDGKKSDSPRLEK